MARITMDIFSGRPNPSWEVDEEQVRELLQDLERGSGITSIEGGPGRLGYRGLIVELDSGRHAVGLGLPQYFRFGAENDGRGRELARRIISELGTPREAQGAPEGLARFDEMDLTSLMDEGSSGDQGGAGGQAAATRSTETTEEATAPDSASVSTTGEETTSSASALAALNPAPVIGTDASSWSTVAQGSCSIEVANFNPNFWNAAGVITNNNCYNYASNRRTDTFAQPGRASGAQATRMRCANVQTGALSDGCLQVPNCAPAGSEPRWYTALVIWPNFDYHWYRKSAEGFWGHKPGQTAARNTDNSNVVITNPETANRGGYREFCSYFFIPASAGVR